jgi:hypothetical protein
VQLLSVVLFNARSLNNKLPDLQYLLSTYKYDVLCITESWLSPLTTNDVILGGCSYTLFRTDRTAPHRGGGVCVLINNSSAKAVAIPIPSIFADLELCVIDIISTSSKFRLFVCYRPPSSDTDLAAVRYISDLCNCVNRLYPLNGTVIICGDFNFPSIDWSADSSLLTSNVTCTGIFLEFYYTHGLRQLVCEPTRGERILDLVLSNDIHSVLNYRILEPFSTSDHSQVSFDLPHKVSTYDYTFNTRDFQSADWSSVRSYLDNIDFYELFQSHLSASLIIEEFYKIICACIELYVPSKFTVISKRSRLVKYPPTIRRKLQKKAAAWRNYRMHKTPEALSSYKIISSQCKSATYSFVRSRESHFVDSGNLGMFFRYANRKLCSKSTIGPLYNNDGVLTTDPNEKASILQHAFVRNFTVDDGRLPCGNNFNQPPSKLCRVLFTPSLVRRAIKKLKVNTTGGPDGIPSTFFINCIDELSYPLSLLFTFSFEHGILPESWLTSFISPIFKKGNPADANNYRPIALTDCMCKLMETIIKDQIVHFLAATGLISKSQHAFIKQHSTATNLLASLHDWSIGLNSPCVLI